MEDNLCYPNNKTKTMNNINFATATAAELEAAGFTVKTLKTRGPRKGEAVLTAGFRTTGYRASGVKTRGGNGNNCGRNNVVA